MSVTTPTSNPGLGARPLSSSSPSFWMVFLALLGIGLLVGSAVTLRSQGSHAASRQAATEPGTPPAEVAPGVPLATVELGDIFIKPAALDVPAGKDVILEVRNGGQMPHNLTMEGGKATRMLAPGETQTVSFGPLTSSATLFCNVPGHRAAGMELKLTVLGAAPAGSAAAPAAQTSADAKIDFSAKPSADWKPFDPVLKPAAGGTTHRLAMAATERVMEVAPGVTQEMWTFDGQVPGPTLRGKVGDVFEITLTNKGKMGHSLDLHASKVAWNDEMRTIGPGESLVYQFAAKHSGIFMYHCGTAPALLHIGNGMYGTIIVDPPRLPKVDREFVLVQSEFYTGPAGQPGDLAKMTSNAPDAVVFNGYVNQYLHAPIRVESGQRIRVWVLDAGPSENSSFHIVGTIFDTVFKEGSYLLRPDASAGGSQALDLQPAQGGFVEFTFDEKGLYPIVTHKFSNVGKGALGLFQAGDVPAAGAGH